MSPGSTREGRKPTTFWMDENTKKEAKRKARQLDTTLTDLINNAVAYYINNLSDINTDFGQRMAKAEVEREVRDKSEINKLKSDIDDLHDRMSKLEQQLQNVDTSDKVRQTVQAHVSAKVDPVVERLGAVIARLETQINSDRT